MPQLHSEGLNLYSAMQEVRRNLNEMTPSYWTDLEIYSFLNQAQMQIAVKSKCLKKTVTITTVADTQTYDLKDNSFDDIFDISKEGAWFYVNGTTYQPIDFTTIKRLNTHSPGWQGVAASVPSEYYYDKATKTIGLHPKPNSSNAGDYLFVNGYFRPKVLNAGTAVSGTATAITLQAGSTTYPYPNPTDDYYNGIYIEIYQGSGAGLKSEITDYDGSAKSCTASFSTVPDTSSIYGMVFQIPEEAHYLTVLYALGKCWQKGGSRKTLANDYLSQYFNEMGAFVGDFLEDDDEILIKESYRA